MRDIANAKLILAGRADEKYLKKITMLCNEFNIADRVIYIGYRNDIPSLLKEIDILVFPALIGEGFPRVILEAMAAGKPVVTTDNAGNTEAVEDGITGYIVPTESISVLAEKLEELVADKKKRAVMGQAGRKRVETFFTIQKNVQRIQEVYFNIIDQNKHYSNLPTDRNT
jgi:glycosyltransferase involved in cell wall biosynthesis